MRAYIYLFTLPVLNNGHKNFEIKLAHIFSLSDLPADSTYRIVLLTTQFILKQVSYQKTKLFGSEDGWNALTELCISDQINQGTIHLKCFTSQTDRKIQMNCVTTKSFPTIPYTMYAPVSHCNTLSHDTLHHYEQR